jgi:hypothetical protein
MPYIGRICPNDSNWTRPDGSRKGKNHLRRSAKTFPEQHGFGFEEWVRRYVDDATWIWKGDPFRWMRGGEYYFGFLQPFKEVPGGFSVDKISLFLIDNMGRGHPRRFYIGYVLNCRRLTDNEAVQVQHSYIRDGLLGTMQAELDQLEVDYTIPTAAAEATEVFNVGFMVNDFHYIGHPVLAPDTDYAYRCNYYTNLNQIGPRDQVAV